MKFVNYLNIIYFRSHESLLSQPAACVAAVVGGAARPLHASLAGGRAHCFLLHLPGPPPSTRYFACASRLERDTWINKLVGVNVFYFVYRFLFY